MRSNGAFRPSTPSTFCTRSVRFGWCTWFLPCNLCRTIGLLDLGTSPEHMRCSRSHQRIVPQCKRNRWPGHDLRRRCRRCIFQKRSWCKTIGQFGQCIVQQCRWSSCFHIVPQCIRSRCCRHGQPPPSHSWSFPWRSRCSFPRRPDHCIGHQRRLSNRQRRRDWRQCSR